MKLDIDLFPVDMVELMNKKVSMCMDQAETAKGKNVVIFDDRMIKPHNPGLACGRRTRCGSHLRG
jgi:hypothetical protein